MRHPPTSLEELPVNFKISLADRMRAASGVPAFVRRKRRIEDLEEALIAALDDIYRDAQRDFDDDPRAAERAFLDAAEKLDLRLLNDLIDRHNRYYPIEANLPLDVHSGAFLQLGKIWQPLPLATLADFLEKAKRLRD